jgi:hypothetical protein
MDLLLVFRSSLHDREIQVESIICDGANCQLKALDFCDRPSIQARNSGNILFFRLLFIPCLYHRLNNAYHCVVRECPALHEIVGSLDALARFCRKPNQRGAIGAKISGTAPHANEARLTSGADSHRRERARRKGASSKDDLKTKSKSMIAPHEQ